VLEPRVLDLNDVRTRLRAVVAATDRGGRRAPHRARARPAATIRADPSQLEQVLVNLAVNARDAMPGGGILTIETANVALDDAYAANQPLVAAGDYMMIAMTDTGTGMDEETQARVFRAVLHDQGAREGNRVGTWRPCMASVKQSGGTSGSIASSASGPTFKVYLPRVPGPAEPPTAVPTTTSSLRGSETILVAEDQEEVRTLIRKIPLGARLSRTDGGDRRGGTGNAALHPGPIHLLVSDVVLPGMSGPEVSLFLTSTRNSVPHAVRLGIHGRVDRTPRRARRGRRVFAENRSPPDGLARKVREVLDAPAVGVADYLERPMREGS